MCSHYEAPAGQQVVDTFGVEPYEQGKLNLWPGYIWPFIRSAEYVDLEADSAVPNEVLVRSAWSLPGAKTPKSRAKPASDIRA